jgi:hypothetical protein
MSAVSPAVGLVCDGGSPWSLCYGLGRMVNNLTKPSLDMAYRLIGVDMVYLQLPWVQPIRLRRLACRSLQTSLTLCEEVHDADALRH